MFFYELNVWTRSKRVNNQRFFTLKKNISKTQKFSKYILINAFESFDDFVSCDDIVYERRK